MSLMIWQAKDGRIWKLKIKILLRGRYTWLFWNLELYYLGHILQIKSWLHNLCLKDCISNCKLQMYWSLAAVFIVATCFGVEWWKWAPLPPLATLLCAYIPPQPPVPTPATSPISTYIHHTARWLFEWQLNCIVHLPNTSGTLTTRKSQISTPLATDQHGFLSFSNFGSDCQQTIQQIEKVHPVKYAVVKL